MTRGSRGTRRAGMLVVLAILAGATASWRALVSAQEALPGTDITTWSTADIASRMSLVGTWRPVETNGHFTGPYWNVVKVGPDQRDAVALGSWVYNGFFGPPTGEYPDVTPARALLLTQDADGTLVDSTDSVLGNATTPGVGAVITGDFNADGQQDVMFVAHNESPFVFKSSVAFISQPDSSLRRVEVGDAVTGHDAQLHRVNGRDSVLITSMGGGGLAASYYTCTWNGTGFTVTRVSQMTGLAGAAAALTGDTRQFLMGGDVVAAPGLRYDPTAVKNTLAYEIIGGTAQQPRFSLPNPYFDYKPEYADVPSNSAYSKTHTVGLSPVDLNQDGMLDILAVSMIWSPGPEGMKRGVYQIMLNRGGMQFTDDTDALNPEFSTLSMVDRCLRFADVDGSGIETLFATSYEGASAATDEARQANRIFVNDGTGRLTPAMHQEFRNLGLQVTALVNARFGRGTTTEGITPQFIPYQTAAGTLNFVAVVRFAGRSLIDPSRFALVNVPLGINLTTDFRRDMSVPGRNGSRRIRTFAGNDTITRALTDPDCTIDGGLGRDVVVYPGSMNDWALQRQGTTVLISHKSGTGGTDRLTRVEIARFADGDVALTP